MPQRFTFKPATSLFASTAVAVVAAVIGVCSFPAVSEAQTELTIAVGVQDGHSATRALHKFAAYLEENSDLEPKVYTLSLLTVAEVPMGLRDGIADVGYVNMPYYPAEFSETNMIADISMLATTGEHADAAGAVMGGAMMEYVMFNCPECLAEFKEQNQVFTVAAGTSPYSLLCNKPVRTIEDLRGKKYRTGAANFGRWAEYVGGTKVSMPGSEIYEALSQGVLDCAIVGVGELKGMSLAEVVSNVTVGVPGGVYGGQAAANVNLDTWESMTPEQRSVFLKGAAQVAADIAVNFTNDAQAGADLAGQQGIEITEATPEMKQQLGEFVQKDVAEVIPQEYAKNYGVENAEQKVALGRELVARWQELTEGIASDPEALAAVYWEQLHSKLDAETYGLQ
jgi:TRAP-type transport system periplasmic protein